MKIYCCCCGKQISKLEGERTAPLPMTYIGPDKYICAICNKDLDEYGLFPEEYSSIIDYGDQEY